MENEKVLSYGDVLLRKSDVKLLDGPFFLNDLIIEFFFTYLASSCPSSSLLLVSPALSFGILHAPDADTLKSFLQPLRLPDRVIVIFALNNNEDVNLAGGGSHWSLLVYDRRANIFEHYDSMAGMNLRHADTLVSAIKPYMGGYGTAAKLKEPWTPQQENGYDCGMYTMSIAETICKYFQEKGIILDLTCLLRANVTSDSVSKMRCTTKELILSLARGNMS